MCVLIQVVWSALTNHSQTELGLNIYGTISEVRDDVTRTHTVAADTHTIVSGVRRDIADARVMISEIHRGVLESQKGIDDRHQSVSAMIRTTSAPNTYSLPPRLK